MDALEEGGHPQEMPPREKVTAAYPRMEVRYALFLIRERRVPFSSFAFVLAGASGWLAHEEEDE